MRIHLMIISFLLFIASASSTIYDFKLSLVKALKLEKEGYFTGALELPHISAAIKNKSERFNRLIDNWTLLVRAITSGSELSDASNQLFLAEFQKDLSACLEQRLINEHWKEFLEDISVKVDELYNNTLDPSDELKQQSLKLTEQRNFFTSPQDFDLQGMWLDEIIGNVERIQGKLKKFYKLNRSNSLEVGRLYIALNDLDTLMKNINLEIAREPPKASGQLPKTLEGLTWLLEKMTIRLPVSLSNRDIRTLGRLKFLFSKSSALHRYVFDSHIVKTPLRSVRKELEDFVIRDKYDALIVLEDLKNLHSLKFRRNYSSYYQYKVHFRNEAVSNLVVQLAYHLKGINRPNLLSEIYAVYREFDKMEPYDQNSVKSLFKIYLWGFKSNSRGREYLERFILTDEIRKAQLAELVNAAIESPYQFFSRLDNVENLKEITDLDKAIKALDNDIAHHEHDIIFHRTAHLGYVDAKEWLDHKHCHALEPLSMVEILRKDLISAYSKETQEYLKKVEIILNAMDDDNDHSSSDDSDDSSSYDPNSNPELRNISQRLFMIYDGWRGDDEPRSLPTTKTILKRIVERMRNMAVPRYNLVSFYHRYVFPELDHPMNQIRQNIDEIIRNLKFFIKAAIREGFVNDFKIPEIVGDRPLIDLYMELTPFLHILREHFDLFLSFPGIKLSPFEDKLYELAGRTYFIKTNTSNDDIMPVNDDNWNQIIRVFQEWLLTLESWKVFIEAYIEQEDFLDPNFESHSLTQGSW